MTRAEIHKSLEEDIKIMKKDLKLAQSLGEFQCYLLHELREAYSLLWSFQIQKGGQKDA